MDYSPTPSKVKPQYAFLDNSIELGRSDAPRATFKGSPLKYQSQNQKDTETFHQRQKQFYNKYTDLNGTPDILKQKQRARTGQSYTDTTPRLFKNITNKVPVDDVVKINSNMIEKIIRENESLKNQLKEEKKETDMLNQFATGMKDKLVKYKNLNETLKSEIEKLKEEKEEIEKKLKSQITPPESPKYNFNPENVDDIFESDGKSTGVPQDVASSKIEERISVLEDEVSKINTNQDEKFEYIKNEIEFLKNLSLQVKESTESKNSEAEEKAAEDESIIPKEDDLIVKESLELKQLQEQVDLFTKKLQLREENKLKKYALNKELEKLAQRLQQDDVPKFSETNLQQEEIHTPINQTSPSTSTKAKEAKNDTAPTTIRERLRTECNVCEKTPETSKPSTPSNGNGDVQNGSREHVPSFKIGDTVWY